MTIDKFDDMVDHPYTLIDGLTLRHIGLIPTEDFFWVGVGRGGKPVSRRKTKTFRRCPVYMYNGKRIFLYSTIENGYANEFYYIPDEELLHIQKVD
jgi:hypothetical protein